MKGFGGERWSESLKCVETEQGMGGLMDAPSLIIYSSFIIWAAGLWSCDCQHNNHLRKAADCPIRAWSSASDIECVRWRLYARWPRAGGGGGVDDGGGVCLFHFEGLSLARTSNGDCSTVKQNISSAEGYCRVPCNRLNPQTQTSIFIETRGLHQSFSWLLDSFWALLPLRHSLMLDRFRLIYCYYAAVIVKTDSDVRSCI